MKIKYNDLYNFHSQIEKKLFNNFKKLLRNSNFIGGPEVGKFEKNFQRLNDSKFCISCANGSDALVIALKALNLKPGDEVITTSLSWIATSAAITMAGGNVKFCDIETDGFNIDVKLIEKKISKKTVGIIPVHLYGIPADMKKIVKLAKKYNLWIIEDCAQAHLAEINGKKVGNFGHFGTYSFFPGKNLGALGDAGCLVTNKKYLAEKARLIANHGGKGMHLLEGMNSRMDSIQASFLNEKLKFISRQNHKRIKNSKIYFKELKKNQNIKLPKVLNYNKNVFHQFVIKTKARDKLKNFLKKKGIETQIHYKQILPLMMAYKRFKYSKKDFPNSYIASKEILSLPVSNDKNQKIIKHITNIINKFKKK